MNTPRVFLFSSERASLLSLNSDSGSFFGSTTIDVDEQSITAATTTATETATSTSSVTKQSKSKSKKKLFSRFRRRFVPLKSPRENEEKSQDEGEEKDEDVGDSEGEGGGKQAEEGGEKHFADEDESGGKGATKSDEKETKGKKKKEKSGRKSNLFPFSRKPTPPTTPPNTLTKTPATTTKTMSKQSKKNMKDDAGKVPEESPETGEDAAETSTFAISEMEKRSPSTEGEVGELTGMNAVEITGANADEITGANAEGITGVNADEITVVNAKDEADDRVTTIENEDVSAILPDTPVSRQIQNLAVLPCSHDASRTTNDGVLAMNNVSSMARHLTTSSGAYCISCNNANEEEEDADVASIGMKRAKRKQMHPHQLHQRTDEPLQVLVRPFVEPHLVEQLEYNVNLNREKSFAENVEPESQRSREPESQRAREGKRQIHNQVNYLGCISD